MIPRLQAWLLETYANRPARISGVPYQTAGSAWPWFWRDLLVRIPWLLAPPVVRGFWDGGLAGWSPLDGPGWIWTLAAIVGVLAVCTTFVFHYPSQQYRWTAGGLLVGGTFFLVTNPLVEELFWRAFVQDALTDHFTLLPALLITSLAFGAHHALAGFGLRFIVVATLGGVLFGLLYEFSGSLIAPVLAHSAADLALFVVGPPLKLRAARKDLSS